MASWWRAACASSGPPSCPDGHGHRVGFARGWSHVPWCCTTDWGQRVSDDAEVGVAAAAVATRDVAGLAALAREGTDLNLLTLPTSSGPQSLLEVVLVTRDSAFVALVLSVNGMSALDALPAHGFWRWAQGAPLAVVRAFLHGTGVDPARTDADGMTLLHEVASAGTTLDVLMWLLERVPADPKAQDGSTPLAHALGGCHLEVAEELRRNGADLNVPTTGTGWTPLITAVVGGDESVVAWLLARVEVDVNRGDASGATALHHASRLGRMDALAELAERGDLDVRMGDVHGRTALMDAARHGRADVVNALLRHPDPGVDLLDTSGWAALDYAGDAGGASMVDALRARSAVPARAAPNPSRRTDDSTPVEPIEVAIGDPPMEE